MSSQTGARTSSNWQSLNLVDLPTEILWAIASAVLNDINDTAVLIGGGLDHAIILSRSTIDQRYEWVNRDSAKKWKQTLASVNALSQTCKTLHMAATQYLYQHTFHFTDSTVMSDFLNSLPAYRVEKMRLKLYVPLLPVQGHLLPPQLDDAQRILRLMTMIYISISSTPAIRSLDLVTLLGREDVASGAVAAARDTHSAEANKIFALINSEADHGFQGRHSLRAIDTQLSGLLEYLITL